MKGSMILDLTVTPENPIYRNCKMQKVTKKGRTSYCLKLKMAQPSVDILNRNIAEHVAKARADGSDKPMQLTGTAPTWVYLVAVKLLAYSYPVIQYKKEKDLIDLI